MADFPKFLIIPKPLKSIGRSEMSVNDVISKLDFFTSRIIGWINANITNRVYKYGFSSAISLIVFIAAILILRFGYEWGWSRLFIYSLCIGLSIGISLGNELMKGFVMSLCVGFFYCTFNFKTKGFSADLSLLPLAIEAICFGLTIALFLKLFKPFLSKNINWIK